MIENKSLNDMTKQELIKKIRQLKRLYSFKEKVERFNEYNDMYCRLYVRTKKEIYTIDNFGSFRHLKDILKYISEQISETVLKKEGVEI